MQHEEIHSTTLQAIYLLTILKYAVIGKKYVDQSTMPVRERIGETEIDFAICLANELLYKILKGTER